MDRDRLIELLIHDQLQKLGIGQHSRRFLAVVEREFRGLGPLSDEELAEELARRGIAAEFESDDEPLDEPDDEDQESQEYEGDEVHAMLGDQRFRDDDWASVPG